MSIQQKFDELGFTQMHQEGVWFFMKREILEAESQIFLDTYIVFDPARREYQTYTKIGNKTKPFTCSIELHNLINEQLIQLGWTK